MGVPLYLIHSGQQQLTGLSCFLDGSISATVLEGLGIAQAS